MFGWGITGFFWAVSLIPSPTTFQYFAHMCTYLLMLESFTAFLQVAMGFISLFTWSDAYENEYQHYTPWAKELLDIGKYADWGEGRSSIGHEFDLELQTMSLTMQFIAYPMV